MKSPTLPARLLGATLEKLREGVGYTREAAARDLDMSQQTLWRIERAQWDRPPKTLTIMGLCRLYNAEESTQATLIQLLEQSRESGWWRKFGNVMAPGFSIFIAQEDAARRMFSYQPALLPGLLQTRGYRRALALTIDPATPDDYINQSIELAARRQRRLTTTTTDRFEVNVVLAETVLRQRVGSAKVMTDQLGRLIESSELPTVSIRVLPTGVPHIGLVTSAFVILECPESSLDWVPDEPPLVYLEHFTGALYLGEHEEVQRYRHAYKAIAEASLTTAATRDLIASITKDLQ
ncbi:helix-turn-helix domain-containing protein [Nocardia sp. NPDC059764]|uniref:helix-turn-helix domain-containing protein n=1 Tax=Nocardia sp. NPDC059764 TaxID=3346939 RepID=UPI00364B6EB3